MNNVVEANLLVCWTLLETTVAFEEPSCHLDVRY